MSLEFINIFNARNLIDFKFNPSPTINIIYGVNGSGKTTILESIYFLLRSRIFRNNKYKSFINIDSSDCTIFSKFSNTSSDKFTLGIRRSKHCSQPTIHLNKNKINSLSQISNLVLLGLVTPESFSLLDSGPGIRRKFLDWGVFHVEHDFLNTWKSYKKILNNRNTLLRNLNYKYKSINNIPDNVLDDLNCWSPQLIVFNNKLTDYRKKQISNLETIFKDYIGNFSKILADKISLEFYKGWSHSISFEKYINTKTNYDLLSGYTRYGAHRADIIIRYDEYLAKDILSRGQKKIIVICLILAQYSFLHLNFKNKHSLLLLDDMDSELDEINLEILFNIISNINSQVIATTTNINKYSFIDDDKYKMFHVEHE